MTEADAAWARDITHLVSQGALLIRLFKPKDLPGIIDLARGGDEFALHVLSSINEFLVRAQKQEDTPEPLRCSACAKPIRVSPDILVGLAFPEDEAARAGAIAFGVCQPCATKEPETLKHRALQVFRECFANFQIVHHEAGNA